MLITNVEQWIRKQVRPSSHINVLTAFFTSKGWVTLFDAINILDPEQGGSCCIVVGMQTEARGNLANLACTVDEQSALGVKRTIAKDLLKHNPSREEKGKMLEQIGVVVDIRVSMIPSHEKLFIIDNTFGRKAIVGSSNFTAAGLNSTQRELSATLGFLDACRASLRFEEVWGSALPITNAIRTVLMEQDEVRKKTPSLYRKHKASRIIDCLCGRYL